MQTQSLQLSYSSLNKKKSHKGLIVGITIIVILAVILVTMIALLVVDNKHKDPKDYGVIISAGADSTTAQVYIWKHNRKNITVMEFHEVEYADDNEEGGDVISGLSATEAQQTVTPGIASLLGLPSENVSNYFAPLIAFVARHIPSHDAKNTPIYVRILAGSGVNKADEAARASLVNDVTKVVKDSGFKVVSDIRCVAEVSEEEEAAGKWLAVNYLKNSICKPDETTRVNKTYGIFTLTNSANGAVFESADGNPLMYSLGVSLAGFSYKVYAHADTSYGRNVALKKLLDDTVGNNDNDTVVNFPCFLNGYSMIYKGYNITGTGNSSECTNLVTKLLNTDAPCEKDPCAINGTYMPSITPNKYKVFFAIDELHAAASFLGLSTGIPTSLGELSEYSKKYCSFHWSYIYKAFSKVYPLERIADGCFNGIYTYKILRAYGIPDDGGRVNFASNVEGIMFDYPYGAMLYEIGKTEK